MQISSVTFTKAIAIILVVLGHAFFDTPIEWWVNFVHVPIFFFMAGFCFKETHLNNPILFLKKRVQGLYIPFIKWGMIFLLLHNVLYSLGVYNGIYGYNGIASSIYTPTEFISKAIRVFLFVSHERLLGGYWFLPCLFVGSVVFFLTLQIIKKYKINIWFGFILLIIISLTMSYYDINWYLLTSRNILAAAIIYAGFIYRNMNLSIHKNTFFIIFSLLLVSVGIFCWRSSMLSITKYTLLPYTITAICASISVFGICTKIEQRDWEKLKDSLNFIGNNTLSILTWHMSAFVFVSFIIICLYNLNKYRIAEFPVIKVYAMSLWGFIYFIVSMCICCFLAYLGKIFSSKLTRKNGLVKN